MLSGFFFASADQISFAVTSQIAAVTAIVVADAATVVVLVAAAVAVIVVVADAAIRLLKVLIHSQRRQNQSLLDSV